MEDQQEDHKNSSSQVVFIFLAIIIIILVGAFSRHECANRKCPHEGEEMQKDY